MDWDGWEIKGENIWSIKKKTSFYVYYANSKLNFTLKHQPSHRLLLATVVVISSLYTTG